MILKQSQILTLSSYDKMTKKMFIFICLFQLLSSPGESVTANSVIKNAKFPSEFYAGYVSENAALPHLLRTRNTTRSILIRFIDIHKPLVQFETPTVSICYKIQYSEFIKSVNLRLVSDADDSSSLFELDANKFQCIHSQTVCKCGIHVKLKSDSVRYRLNREAKSVYKFQLKLDQSYAIKTTNIQVNILDDNDLEPMFDPSEYEFELNEFDQTPAFTKIGTVYARDPDLDRNSLLRYYLNTDGLKDDVNHLFGVDWSTGEIFIKKSLSDIFKIAFNQTETSERVFEFEIKSLDDGVRTNVARNLLRQSYKKSGSRIRKMLRESFYEDDDDENTDVDPVEKDSNYKQTDLINYKLIHYASSLYESAREQSNDVSYFGTSIEVAYVKVRLIRSFKSRQDYKVKFFKLAGMNIDANLNEQIMFKLEKNFDTALPFGFLQILHVRNLNLVAESLLESNLIRLRIEQVYLNDQEMDSFLIFLQPNYTEILAIRELMLSNTKSMFNLTINAYDLTGQIYVKDLIQIAFDFHQDLLAIIKQSCSLELPIQEYDLDLANPSPNSVLLQIESRFKSSYGSDSMCEFFLSKNFWYDQGLFHTRFSESHNQTFLSIDAYTGVIRLEKIFYGKLMFQFNAGLFYQQNQLDNKHVINVRVKSVDHRPNLNTSSPIHAVVTVGEELIPVVTYFKKISSQNVFDSIHLTLTTTHHRAFVLPKILAALNWHYNQFTNYELVYCFKSNDLHKFENCPFDLNENGTSALSYGSLTDQVNLLIRLSNDFNVDSTPFVKYLNIMINNASNHVQFEHENCSVLIRRSDDMSKDLHVQTIRKIKNFNFEQVKTEPVFLIRMSVKQNETLGSRFKFSLVEGSSMRNQLDGCFTIDPDMGDVYFKCKWPYAHHSLFRPNSKIARIEKTLKIKVRKYPKNIEAVTHLTIQFELNLNSSINNEQVPNFNILMFNCAQQYTDKTNLKENYLVNKLLTNDFKHILRKIKTASVQVPNSAANNFNRTEFDITYKPSNSTNLTKIPAGTKIYRLDLVNLLRMLKIPDIHDEAMFYEYNQLDNELFLLDRLTGLITLALDWYPESSSDKSRKYELKFSLIKSIRISYQNQNKKYEDLHFTANIRFDFQTLSVYVLPKPVLATRNIKLTISDHPTNDYLLMDRLEAYLLNSNQSVYDIYTVTYKLSELNIPFYVEVASGQLFYNNLLERDILKRYKFDLIVLFKNENRFVHELRAHVHVVNKISQISDVKKLKPTSRVASGIIDLSIPITSVDFISNMQCKLIGFFPISPENTGSYFKLMTDSKKPPEPPVVVHHNYQQHGVRNRTRLGRKKHRKIRYRIRKPLKFSVKSNAITKRDTPNEDADLINKFVFNKIDMPVMKFNDSDYEDKLLWNSFYSLLYLDNSTGALYFDLASNNQEQNLLYSKLAQLIDFYYYDQNLPSKSLKVDAVVLNKEQNRMLTSIWIDLVFKRSSKPRVFDIKQSDLANTNKFLINSNNLLNLFNNGDEFVTSVEVLENSPSNKTLINMLEYFRSKVNLRSSKNLVHFNILKTLRFYIVDQTWNSNLTCNDIFKIDDNVQGELQLKSSVQFDYEIAQVHNAKIMIVQYLNQRNIDQEKFIYWLDLNVHVKNVIDEPFKCESPIYYLTITENQVKNKKLLTIDLIDFDMNRSMNVIKGAETKFHAEVLAGNEQGLFEMNGLTLFTSSSRKRLDRETLDHYEITVKISELNTNRVASCMVIVQLTDLNDNRPIVNDIELVIYDKLDTRLVDEMKIPIANAIAIDTDLISKLSYRITSVRYFYGLRQYRRTAGARSSSKLTKQQINEYFTMNSTNGNLYAQKTPCVECTIIVQYRANDIGQNKNRISRRSSIKLHVKKLPVSLFKMGGFASEVLPENPELDINPAIKTFDLHLDNSTRFTRSFTNNRISLDVNEDTKLGEKLYQINIEQKIALNQLAIIYFNMLGTDEANSRFYVSNNDGSLYLVKALDYETMPSYNLTILITNWLGQIEYVFIEINVRDVNDNRPYFSNNRFSLNQIVDLNAPDQPIHIELVTAFDKDLIDSEELSFLFKDCFYTPKNLLIKKSEQNVACDLFRLANRLVNSTHQFLNLDLDTNGFRAYLNESSDFFLRNKTSMINFKIDISVTDRSQKWFDLCRINLNVYLNSTGLTNIHRSGNFKQIASDQDLESIGSRSSVEFGFKKPAYFIKIKSNNELSDDTELIRLNQEFVQFDSEQNYLRPFESFELEFFAIQNRYGFINVEKHFGLVYFNQTINTELLHRDENIIQVNIGCKIKSMPESRENSNKILFNTTKLIVYIDNSVLVNNRLNEDLVYHPIWSETKIEAFVYENSPAKTWLTTKDMQRFTVRNYISQTTVDSLATSFTNLMNRLIISLESSELIIEENTGYMQTMKEFNYEESQNFNVSLTICLRASSICFRQKLKLTVQVLNRNDNEPKLNSISDDSLDLSYISEIMRSMSLFKFSHTDADSDRLEVRLEHSRISTISNCTAVNYVNPIEWFKVFTNGDNSTIQLTDLGYDTLIHFSSKINYFHLKKCHFKVNLIIKANDGLFTNQLNFNLNVLFEEERNNLIRTNIPVPVLNSIEFTENIETNKFDKEYLINIHKILTGYLTVQVHNKTDLNYIISQEVSKFELKNYEDLFYLKDNQLYLRKDTKDSFDRENRDTYELFIGLKPDRILAHSNVIPSKFRVLIKLNDLNDNAPQFYEPLETSLSGYSSHDWCGYNQTLKWNKLLESDGNHPVLVFKASDLDIGSNGIVEYHLNASTTEMRELTNFVLKIDPQNGNLFLNPRLKNNQTLLDLMWNTYSMSYLRLNFDVIAKDKGTPSMEQIVRVKLDVLFNTGNNGTSLVHFNQTFYYFQIPESIDFNYAFGYVNSIVRFRDEDDALKPITIYSISDGDLYDQFYIDFRTGALSVKSRLEFEIASTYLLTISAYDVANFDHVVNATVRIDIDDVYDNALKFSKYEYDLEIDENIPKMSKLIQLNVINETRLKPEHISYQLLNNLDKFYINERTGAIYNKITFDYESTANSLKLNQLQLKVKAKSKKKSPMIKKHLVNRPFEADCVLNIKIRNINDNPPQFEKTAYISRIQINKNQDQFDNIDASITKSILPVLLDKSTHKTYSNSIKFVSKVDAKDIDSNVLSYSILSQFQTGSSVLIDIFTIENQTGIVYLNLNKYTLLKEFNKITESTEFNIQLLVSDSMLTNQARMTVYIEEIEEIHHNNQRPAFKIPIVNLNLDMNRFKHRRQKLIRLLNLERNLIKSSASSSHLFTFNLDQKLDLFKIKSNKLLVFDIEKFNNHVKYLAVSSLSYQIPIIACDQIETGLCDQILVRVNVSSINHTSKVKSLNGHVLSKDNISFAYKYGVLTVQQQMPSNSPSQEETKNLDYDDYYLDDSYTSNERFYTELRIANHAYKLESVSKKTDFEFELLGCIYRQLNATIVNNTLMQEISEFQLHSRNGRLTLKQLKSLFLLNKHNGVLSSRKTINEMLPGVYVFTIRLRSDHYYSSVVLDSMKYKLIVLPANSNLDSSSKSLFSYFKFNREMYKFDVLRNVSIIGKIGLIEKVQPEVIAMKNKYQTATDLNVFKRIYTLIDSKSMNASDSMAQFIHLNPTSGELMLKSGVKHELIRKVNENKLNRIELVVYALAQVEIDSNILEYMCEIVLDFDSLILKNKSAIGIEQTINSIQFGRSKHELKVSENLRVNSTVYRFTAIHHSHSPLFYSIIDESEYFHIESKTGILVLKQSFDKELISFITFKAKACAVAIISDCAETAVYVNLIDVNDNWPIFDRSEYQGRIREDSLPGTVVLTVSASDADFHKTNGNQKSTRLEYYIINGDSSNQFAISNDGKVYTRLMLDTETKDSYSLSIMAFDGRFKALTNLNVDILNVNDNRPVCSDNLVYLNVSEDISAGEVFYTVNATDPDMSSNELRYEIVNYYNDYKVQLPFSVHPNYGSLRLIRKIDYETRQFYSFYIRVFKFNEDQNDKALPWLAYCMVQVNVEVLDVNDNKPFFKESHYITSLNENSPIGSLLLNQTQFIAHDLDSFLNRGIQYLFTERSQYFKIDPRSGVITLSSNKFDRETIGNWLNLTVRAIDAGGLYSDCIVSIKIIDLNDNEPVFEQPNLFISLQENLPAGFLVIKLKAVDSDLNSTIEYSLLNSTGVDKFHVDSSSGDVILSEPLDYEEQSNYVMYVAAVDKSLGKGSMADKSVVKLSVDVLDLNDNTPQFSLNASYVFYVNENSAVNTTLGILKAYDLDSSETNRKLEFRILEKSPYFGIDEHTGRLFTKARIDYEQLKDMGEIYFNLTVECSDSGTVIRRKNTKSIEIHVRDINDNRPIFDRQNQTIIFRESFELGEEITKFSVDDPDHSEQFTFVIIEQFRVYNSSRIYLTNPMFSINRNGSLILVKKAFSDEEYLVHVRCYDQGNPPLFSDTYLTIKVADEQSNEPKMNDNEIEIITLGSLRVHEPASLIKIESGQIIGKLIATDADPKDTLYYQLQGAQDQFSVNKLTGVLKSDIVLIENSQFNSKPLVTDKKFMTERNLKIVVNNINGDCLKNSVYIKLNTWSKSGMRVSLKKFVQHGYLTRFKEIVSRIINSNKVKYNIGYSSDIYGTSNIRVLGLRSANVSDEDDLFSIWHKKGSALVEILFSVESSRDSETCINSKLISKLLNRRKSVIVKRMRLRNQAYSFKLIDMSYNNECFGTENKLIPSRLNTKLTSICSINQAFQNCHLKFDGYNNPDLCQFNKIKQKNMCYLIPKYDWSCDENKEQLLDKNSLKTTAKTYLITDDDNVEKSDSNDFIGSCRRPHNPCKNNAICKQVKIASLKASEKVNFKIRVHCFCPNGFKGQFCEEDINECDSSANQQIPCISDAECINTHGSYYCNCTKKPTSLCYNTLSPQYSASKSVNYKYYGRNDGENLYLDKDGIVSYSDTEPNKIKDDELLFGLISSSTVRQGLLGIFGAICGILIILTLAAGFICQMNLTKRRERYAHAAFSDKNSSEMIEHSSSSNVNSVTDGLSTSDSNGNNIANSNYTSTCEDLDPSSSISSPSNISIKKTDTRLYKSSIGNGRLSKNRSSMTASLISGSEISSSHLITSKKPKRTSKNNKYSINNLLFARLNANSNRNKNQIPLSVCSSQETTSSGSSSPGLVKTKLVEEQGYSTIETSSLLAGDNIKMPQQRAWTQQQPDMYGLIKECENDADDEENNIYQSTQMIHSKSGTLKPIKLLAELKNDMSSFSRERPYKKKPINPDGTLVRKHFGKYEKVDSEVTLHNDKKIEMFKYNTLKIHTNVDQSENQLSGFNTISQSSMKTSRLGAKPRFIKPNTTSFLTALPDIKKSSPRSKVDENKDDSIEDNCQEEPKSVE